MRHPLRVRLAAAALLAPLALVGCSVADDEPPLRSENGSEIDGEGQEDVGSEPEPVESQGVEGEIEDQDQQEDGDTDSDGDGG